MNIKPPIEKEFLMEQYVSLKKSINDIHNEFKISKNRLYKYLRLYKLIRTQRESCKIHFEIHPEKREFYSKLYSGSGNPAFGKVYEHKLDCKCAICQNIRGERKGTYHLTNETKQKISVANTGKKRTEEQKKKISKAVIPSQERRSKQSSIFMKDLWQQKEFREKMLKIRKTQNKDIIVKHHIDGNKKNNIPENFLYIKNGIHRSLHFKAYDYLVRINLHKEYIKEFIIKYDINILSNDGKLVHHIDCNRTNDNPENLIYLEGRGIHNKLHQEAYLYLVKIQKIKDYFIWFFSKERENHLTNVYSKEE